MGEKGNAVAQGVTASKGFVDEVISVGESGGGFVAGVVTTAATAATAKHLEGRISERLDKKAEDENDTPPAPV
jgi:hypothetical protein